MSYPFPLEIFPIIFDLVESDQDLFRLASSSSVFNHFALKAYFSRHRLDPHTKNIQLPASPTWTFRQSNAYMQALLLSLDLIGRDIDTFCYQYSVHDDWTVVVQQAKMVNGLLNCLGKIHELKLGIFTPSNDYKNGLGQANANLLDTVCRMDRLSQLQLSGSSFIYTQPTVGWGPTKLGFKNVVESSLPLLWVQKKLSFGQHRCNKGPNPTSGLRRLKIDSFPFAFRQFSLDILQLSAPNLTHLHLLNVLDCSESDFTTFLMGIDLPSLTFLIIRSCNRIHQKALFDFVSRHATSITNLCYTLDSRAGYTSPIPVAKLKAPPILVKLERICATVSYMPHFLTSASSLLSLTNVILSSTPTASGDGEEILTDAIKALQGCVGPLDLLFSSSWSGDEFGKWFKHIEASHPRPSCTLTCVRSLNLSYLHREFTHDEVDYLPTLLGFFPAVEEMRLEIYKDKLSAKDSRSSSWNKARSKEVAERLKGDYPSIRKFSVLKGSTVSLAWTFDQGCNIPVFVTL